MMTLASYLKHSGTSQAEFALSVSVEQPTVSRWLNGARPSWEKAITIEKVTNGAVPVAVWAENHFKSPSSDASKGCLQKTDSLPEEKLGDAPADIQGQGAA